MRNISLAGREGDSESSELGRKNVNERIVGKVLLISADLRMDASASGDSSCNVSWIPRNGQPDGNYGREMSKLPSSEK